MNEYSSFQKSTTKRPSAPSYGAWVDSENTVFMAKNSGGLK